MKNFLNLSQVTDNGSRGIVINLNQIKFVIESPEEEHKRNGMINSVIFDLDNNQVFIQETLPEIIGAIKRAQQ